jgi:hypothetical protein
MLGNARTQKTNSMSHVSNQTEKNRSSRRPQAKAANSPMPMERRTHSEIREPVDTNERAMDIAIGGEGKPWVERRKTA